jgi:hypothetical protein
VLKGGLSDDNTAKAIESLISSSRLSAHENNMENAYETDDDANNKTKLLYTSHND